MCQRGQRSVGFWVYAYPCILTSVQLWLILIVPVCTIYFFKHTALFQESECGLVGCGLCLNSNIQQNLNLNFPSQKWESGFCFGFCKEEKWVSHCKTGSGYSHVCSQCSDSKTEDSFKKGKQRVIGSSYFAVCWELYISFFSTEPPINYFQKYYPLISIWSKFIVI